MAIFAACRRIHGAAIIFWSAQVNTVRWTFSLRVRTAKRTLPMTLPTGLWIRTRSNEKSTRLYVAGNYSGAGDICQLRHDGGVHHSFAQRRGYIWPAIKSAR